MQLAQFLLEAFAALCEHAVLFRLAALAPDAQTRFGTVAVQLPDLGRLLLARLEGAPRSGLRRGLLAALDGDPVVAVRTQPGDVGLRRQARIHDDGGFGGSRLRQLREGRGQGAGFGHVAGQQLGAQGEAAAVEGESHADQGAVVAALLGAPVLAVLARRAAVVHVGEIDEDDGCGVPEEAAGALGERSFEGLAMAPKAVADAVQLVQVQWLAGFDAEQFQGCRSGVEPLAGSPLGGGVQHARDDQGGGQAGPARGHALALQGVAEVQFLQGLQGNALGADAAYLGVVQGVEMHGGAILGGLGWAALAQAVVELQGELMQFWIGVVEGQALALQVLQDGEQIRPLVLRDGEVGTEVEQGLLAHAAGGAPVVHQAEGEIGTAGFAGAGGRAANEPRDQCGSWGAREEPRNWSNNNDYGTTTASTDPIGKSSSFRDNGLRGPTRRK